MQSSSVSFVTCLSDVYRLRIRVDCAKRGSCLIATVVYPCIRQTYWANLHALGADGKTIQAILRHSNVSLTMNVYVKSVSESQVSAMDSFSAKLGTCNDLATDGKPLVN
jgi:hypothetical protein